MGALRSNAKFLCLFMAGLTLIVLLPCQSGFAALINTETVLNPVPGDEARNQLRQFLSRADVRTVLMAHNIDPGEAKKRIDTLTDDEVIRIYQRIDQLPAGGGAAEVLLILLVAVILVFIILDLSGVTDVFTFIKPQK